MVACLDAFNDAAEGCLALAGLGLPTSDLLWPGFGPGVDTRGCCFLLFPSPFLFRRIELTDYPPDFGHRRPGPASDLGYGVSLGSKLADLVRRNIFTACIWGVDIEGEQACEEMKECVARAATWAIRVTLA